MSDRTRRALALACHLTVAAGYLALGLVYVATPRPMPYHLQVAGAPWEELAPGVRRLVLALLRGGGIGALGGGAALLVLILVPLRRGEAWARVAVPALAAGVSGGVLAVTLWLEMTTDAATPYPALIVALALSGAGWLLSRPKA